MAKVLDRFPLLQRLLGRPTQADNDREAIYRAQEKRIKLLSASLSFLTNTLNAAADGVMAIHFASGAKYTNPQFAEMWGEAPEALMAPGQETQLMALHATMVKDEAQFIARATVLWEALDSPSFDEIEMKDGRILERTITPSAAACRVWVRKDREAVSCLMRLSCARWLDIKAFSDSVGCFGRCCCKKEPSGEFAMAKMWVGVGLKSG